MAETLPPLEKKGIEVWATHIFIKDKMTGMVDILAF